MSNHSPTSQDRAYTARDLRGGLANLGSRLSFRRRVAAVVPVILALIALVLVPAFAADYKLDGSRVDGRLDAGVGVNGGPLLVINNHGAPIHTNAGTLLLNLVPGSGASSAQILAYCIDIKTRRNTAATYRAGERPIDVVAYILNHNYYPNKINNFGPLPGGDRDAAAASVQLALWHANPGDAINIDADVTAEPGFSPARLAWIKKNADAIITDAGTGTDGGNADKWVKQQQMPPTVTVTAKPGSATAPGSSLVTATAKSQTAKPIPVGTLVTFTVTGGNGLVGGKKSTPVGVDANGNASVEVTSQTPGTVKVDAAITAGSTNLAYQQLVPAPGSVNSQRMIFATETPATGVGTVSITFNGAPKLTFTKEQADGAGAATTQGIAAKAGDTITYSIKYGNTGNSATSDAVITDFLNKDNLGLLDIKQVKPLDGGVLTGRGLRWDAGAIQPNTSGVKRFTVVLPSVTTTTNFCNVAAVRLGGGSPTESNQVCAMITIATAPGLKVEKKVDSATAALGQTLHYTVTVTNTGNTALTGVSVTDVLKGNDPAGAANNLDKLTKVTVAGGTFDTDPNSATYRTVAWTGVSLAVGRSQDLTFSADVPSTGLPHDADTCFVNFATAGGGNSGSGKPQSGIVTTCVHPAVCVTALPASVSINGPVTFVDGAKNNTPYTVDVRNDSDLPITTATLTVTLPQGFVVTSTTPSSPTTTVNGDTVTIILPAMASRSQLPQITIGYTVPTGQAAGRVTAAATLDATANNTVVDCAPAKATTSGTTEGTVTASQVQAVDQGPVAVNAPVSTPNTGAGGSDLLRPGIIGVAMIISGLVVLTGLRRNPHELV